MPYMTEIHIHRSEEDITGRKTRLQNLQPDAVRAYFNAYLNGILNDSPEDHYDRGQMGESLDDLLLIDNNYEPLSRLDGEQLSYNGTDYPTIKRFLKAVQPRRR